MSATPLTRAVFDEIARVVDLRAALDGAEVDLDMNEWLDAIEGETNFQEAIEEVAKAIFEIDGQIAGVKSMEETLRKRRARLEGSREGLRGVILAAMDRAEVSSIKRPFCTVSVRDKPREIATIDEAEIPSRFFIPQPPKLDKKALRDALRDGEQIEGATLDNGGKSLSVRFA